MAAPGGFGSATLTKTICYETVQCTNPYIWFHTVHTHAIGAFSDLIYCTWNSTKYSFKFKNWNRILFSSPTLFPLLEIVMQFLLNQKTKQHCLYKFTVLEIFIIYCILYSSPQKQHPQFPLEESSMRNPKKVSQKVATLEKTTFLYRSMSLISLCVLPTTVPCCP